MMQARGAAQARRSRPATTTALVHPNQPVGALLYNLADILNYSL